MKLKPFDSAARCPKCGSDEIGAYWCAGKWLTIIQDSHLPTREGVEHMHRTCQRCHFVWYEAPLDAPPEPAP